VKFLLLVSNSAIYPKVIFGYFIQHFPLFEKELEGFHNVSLLPALWPEALLLFLFKTQLKFSLE